jgi:sugar O-acyltransferase (sialic acid O-acetyltransferase NeuD family)
MKPVVIVGAGKVAEVVYRHVLRDRPFEIAGFTCEDTYVPASRAFLGLPVVDFAQLEERFAPASHDLLVAVGYHDLNRVRRRFYDEAKARGYRLASYLSARAGVGDWLAAGDNCIILDQATVEPGATLGNNVVLWSNVLVGHHTAIADHCWLAGHAVFGGSASLGEGSFVGLGAIVAHEVEIGAESFLGAGVLVTKCADAKSVFVAAGTERFRLDSDRFLRITKMR